MAAVITQLVLAATVGTVTPAATAEEPVDPPGAAIFGDSILVNTERDVVPAVGMDRPVDFVKAQGGSSIDYHAWRVIREVEKPDGPDILLVFLGTAESNKGRYNLRSWREDIRRFMGKVEPHVTCVRWFDIQTV